MIRIENVHLCVRNEGDLLQLTCPRLLIIWLVCRMCSVSNFCLFMPMYFWSNMKCLDSTSKRLRMWSNYCMRHKNWQLQYACVVSRIFCVFLQENMLVGPYFFNYFVQIVRFRVILWKVNWRLDLTDENIEYIHALEIQLCVNVAKDRVQAYSICAIEMKTEGAFKLSEAVLLLNRQKLQRKTRVIDLTFPLSLKTLLSSSGLQIYFLWKSAYLFFLILLIKTFWIET